MSDLGRAARGLLKTLKFRESLGTSWLVTEPQQRFGLVVPTLLAGEPSGRLEYLHSYNGTTLRTLHGAGLVEYGPDVEMPAFGYGTEWHASERRRGRLVVGSTVSLTDKARQDVENNAKGGDQA